MQFEDESFGAVIDKGGLDALMEPELGPKLGNQYLSEVCGFSILLIQLVHAWMNLSISSFKTRKKNNYVTS